MKHFSLLLLKGLTEKIEEKGVIKLKKRQKIKVKLIEKKRIKLMKHPQDLHHESKLNITFMLGYLTKKGAWQHMASSDSISKLLDSKWLKDKDDKKWIIKKRVRNEQIESICELI